MGMLPMVLVDDGIRLLLTSSELQHCMMLLLAKVREYRKKNKVRLESELRVAGC
jgi:hypothetical protein